MNDLLRFLFRLFFPGQNDGSGWDQRPKSLGQWLLEQLIYIVLAVVVVAIIFCYMASQWK